MKFRYFLCIAVALVIVPFRLHAVTHTAPASKASVFLAEVESEEYDGADDRYEAPERVAPPPVVVPPSAINVNTEAPIQNTNATTSPIITTAAPVPSPTVSAAFPWAWIVTRAAGIASYLLLALMTVAGISLSTGLFFRFVSPATAWSIHRAIGSTLLISVLVHLSALLADSFMALRFIDVFIPLISPYRPTLVALGISGFYLLLLVLGTSLYTMTKHARFWRLVHYLAFPMFVLIFLHGVLIGTDTKQLWMKIIYWVSAIVVFSFVTYRLTWRFRRRSA